MRFKVHIAKHVIARSDVGYMALLLDGLITRFRDIVVRDSMFAVALSRVVAQTCYRLASERYIQEDRRIVFNIELAKAEAEALMRHADRLRAELKAFWGHYVKLLGRAKCKTCVESRIFAIEALLTIFTEIAEQTRNYNWRDDVPLLSLEG